MPPLFAESNEMPSSVLLELMVGQPIEQGTLDDGGACALNALSKTAR